MALLEAFRVSLNDPVNWLVLLLGGALIYIVYFVQKIRSFPPGPPPLPIVGNILQLRSPPSLYKKAIEWSDKFGDPITVWLGNRPFVVASTKESFNEISKTHRNNLAGRMHTNFGSLITGGRQSITFGDFSPSWDVLRRVAHVAIRKYAQTEKLAHLVAARVDDKLADIFSKEKRFDADVVDFVEEVLLKVVAESVFGGFEKGDPRYEKFREANTTFEKEGANGLPSDIMPLLRWIFYRRENIVRKALLDSVRLIESRFKEAVATFESGKSRHFSDALLNTREQFIAEDRDSAKYLDIENLGLVVVELFEAGVGTSKSILTRCILQLANELQLQEELREEVLGVLGPSQICLKSDREKMPKVESFIQEVLRLYPPAPLSLPRRALIDVSVNGRMIPKDSAMFINLFAVNRDPSIWGPDAAEWNPRRFMTVSKEQLSKGFTSFGIGARSCPGTKMAQADLFYSLVRLLQKAQVAPAKGKDAVDLELVNSGIIIDHRRQNLSFNSII